jgi:hypothetical protein
MKPLAFLRKGGILALLTLCFLFTEQPALLAEVDQTVLAKTEWLAPDPCASPFAEAGENWMMTADARFAETLKSDDASVRAQALGDLIFLIERCGKLIPLPKSTEALLDVYGFDRNESHRIMAVAALYGLDDENAMERLRVLSEQVVQSERVLKHTQRALRAYYAARQ